MQVMLAREDFEDGGGASSSWPPTVGVDEDGADVVGSDAAAEPAVGGADVAAAVVVAVRDVGDD